MKKIFFLIGMVALINFSIFASEASVDKFTKKLNNQRYFQNNSGMINTFLAMKDAGTEISGEMLYFEAEAYYKNAQKAYAYILLTRYIETVGKEGEHFKNAMQMLEDAEKEYIRYLPTQAKALVEDVYIDVNTGLIWQDDKAVQEIRIGWGGAKKYCDALALRGFRDWRLPTYKELLTIVDYSRAEPAIKENFIYSSLGGYWTSTPDAASSSQAWDILFLNGETFSYSKSELLYVRCVRGQLINKNITADVEPCFEKSGSER